LDGPSINICVWITFDSEPPSPELAGQTHWVICTGSYAYAGCGRCQGMVNANWFSKFYQRGVSERKSGHAPFMSKLYFYHVTGLLAEFGVKWTPLVAWEGAQPLFLAYHRPKKYISKWFWHKQPTYALISTWPHVFFTPQNTISILLICC